MFVGRSLVRLISRCLIAALLLQVALPSWAAIAASSKAGWMEICAAGGMQWVKLAQPESPADDHNTSHDHCVLCASTGATSDFDASACLPAPLREEAISVQAQAVPCGFAGHAILSRAPPG